MANASLTWLGHASFRIDSPNGKRIYIDPWAERADLPRRGEGARAGRHHRRHPRARRSRGGRRLSSGRSTGRGSSRSTSSRAGSTGRAIPTPPSGGMGKGGTVDVDGIKFTLTNAFHSSSTPDGSYAGEPAGVVVELENGFTALPRRRHVRLRRHAADRADLRARPRHPPDRRPLHDGPARGRRGAGAARRASVASRATGERSRS